ncbi:MAG: hypothetical protein GOV15_01285, partial [Candidatus Diapherotrites archaeon]|nr:hypothetical protein [Candidatus Diapherotrites archaeon]
MKVDKLIIQVVSVLLALLIYFVVPSIAQPDKINVMYISSFGFLAFSYMLLVLLTPLLFKLNKNKLTTSLLRNQRWIGIFTFLFALTHVILVYTFFFNWDFVKAAENPLRNLGAVALLILSLMAATSNDFAVKKLGWRWKRLHNLV